MLSLNTSYELDLFVKKISKKLEIKPNLIKKAIYQAYDYPSLEALNFSLLECKGDDVINRDLGAETFCISKQICEIKISKTPELYHLKNEKKVVSSELLNDFKSKLSIFNNKSKTLLIDKDALLVNTINDKNLSLSNAVNQPNISNMTYNELLEEGCTESGDQCSICGYNLNYEKQENRYNVCYDEDKKISLCCISCYRSTHIDESIKPDSLFKEGIMVYLPSINQQTINRLTLELQHRKYTERTFEKSIVNEWTDVLDSFKELIEDVKYNSFKYMGFSSQAVISSLMKHINRYGGDHEFEHLMKGWRVIHCEEESPRFIKRYPLLSPGKKGFNDFCHRLSSKIGKYNSSQLRRLISSSYGYAHEKPFLLAIEESKKNEVLKNISIENTYKDSLYTYDVFKSACSIQELSHEDDCGNKLKSMLKVISTFLGKGENMGVDIVNEIYSLTDGAAKSYFCDYIIPIILNSDNNKSKPSLIALNNNILDILNELNFCFNYTQKEIDIFVYAYEKYINDLKLAPKLFSSIRAILYSKKELNSITGISTGATYNGIIRLMTLYQREMLLNLMGHVKSIPKNNIDSII